MRDSKTLKSSREQADKARGWNLQAEASGLKIQNEGVKEMEGKYVRGAGKRENGYKGTWARRDMEPMRKKKTEDSKESRTRRA